MGGLQDFSDECDYVFMRPTSLPVLKCEIENHSNNQMQFYEENIYLVPRPIDTVERHPGNEKYPMVDMSELFYSPDRPEFTSEIVTPDRKNTPPKRQHQGRSDRLSGETVGFAENRIFKRNPQKCYEAGSGPKSSSPTEKRAMMVKKKGLQEKSATMEEGSSYVNMVHTSSDTMTRQQIDINSNIRIKNADYGLNPGLHKSLDNDFRERNSECERKNFHSSTNDQFLDENISSKPHFVECYYLEPMSKNRSLPIPPLPPYNPPSPPSVTLGQRRLPPTPMEEYLDFQCNETGNERNKIRIQQNTLMPETNSLFSEPNPTSSPAPSKPRWIYEETFRNSSPPPLQSRSSEPNFQTEKLPNSKVKGVSLFGKSLLSKHSMFSKNSKLEKSLSVSNLMEKVNFQEKSKPESSSPKLSKKIHPVADMIKKRRGTMHALLMSATSMAKSSQSSEIDSFSQESVYSSTLSSSSAMAKSNKAKSKKPCLAVTKSLPLPDCPTVFTPPKPKHLNSAHFHPGFFQNDFVYTNVCKKSPENVHNNRSFLYQPETEQVNSCNDLTTSLAKTSLSNAVTFNQITASTVENFSCDGPFYQHHNAVVKVLPTESEYRTRRVLDTKQSGYPRGVQIEYKSNQGKATHNGRSRFLSQDLLDDGVPSSPINSSLYSATFSPGQLYVKKEKELSPRPPPPSLKKIREARVKSSQNNANGRKGNRLSSESGFQSDMNSVASSEVWSHQEQKQRHFSNSEMLNEDPPYSTISDLTDNFRKLAVAELRNNHHRGYETIASSMISERSNPEWATLRHNKMMNRGSVESTESDLSVRDIEGTAIYEDIVDFNLNMGHHNLTFWNAPHQIHKVPVGKM